MNDVGYIKLHRRIRECKLWDDEEERFDKRSAWIDLLLSAAHKETTFVMGMKKYTLLPGQLHTSIEKLAVKWNWNRKTVMKYLTLLEQLEMIRQVRTPKGTTISIVNWAFYQDFDKQDGQQNGQQQGQQHGHIQEYKEYKEKDIPKGISQKKGYPYKEIIEYLNQKANKKYRPDSKSSQKLIKARMDEGFTLDDFKVVIDNKTAQWKDDPKMCDYLQPSTLFAVNHFEDYLNHRGSPGKNLRMDDEAPHQRDDYDTITEEIDFYGQLSNM